MNSNATRTIEVIDAELAKLQAERVQLVRARKDGLKLGQHDKVAIGTPGRLVTLDGRPIAGSYEVMHGMASITTATREPDGTLSFDYEGGTEVYWNGQKTVRSSLGEIVFVDEDGEIVHENHVKLISEDGNEEDAE
ncbi:hypothetical protein A8H39_02085 [Paraburkholderia fungorum]|uniref:hypothetical protein n=1 Tax=Paraburkholderia fungorum TaxID=134537 RepID=UPI000488B6D6|nr:hypothetical protein [Paraburkholderia fungorum]MBB5546560.1 hypothetical protein [Paraburkholderia fungorum]PNE59958.1 hypothetical protein A8H39_02085 [Paraburkholderia fungorum]